SLQDLGSIGPHTLDLIDEETERMVEEAKSRALHVLRVNWGAVQETARALLEHETLSGHALDAVLATVREVEIEEIPMPEGEAQRGADPGAQRGRPRARSSSLRKDRRGSRSTGWPTSRARTGREAPPARPPRRDGPSPRCPDEGRVPRAARSRRRRDP